MKVEVPELKRCCFCIPLRYGLIAWGYIKVILALLHISYAVAVLVWYSRRRSLFLDPGMFVMEVVMLSGFIFFMLLDISFSILFLVGAHRKTVKLLQVFYVYSIVVLSIFTLFYLWSVGTDMYYIGQVMQYVTDGHVFLYSVIRIKIIIGVITLGVQSYLIIATRSEINKLRNNTRYRFMNHASDQTTQENGINALGTAEQVDGTVPNRNGTDEQFEGIIDQTKDERETYSYNKF